jgi:hypothetical protein
MTIALLTFKKQGVIARAASVKDLRAFSNTRVILVTCMDKWRRAADPLE